MKFAVISDTHIHPWSAFSTGTGLDNTRMRQSLKVLEDALRWASDNDTVLVHAGDWIHTTGHAKHTVASALRDLLKEWKHVPVVTVWGNHDSRGRGSEVHYEETLLGQFEDLPNFHILDQGTFTHEDITFTGLGAQPDPTLLDLDRLAENQAHVCILHAMVSGASFPSGTTAKGVDPDVLLGHWPLSIVGDIHHPHVHQESGSTVLIPGAPEHHNFGDHGPRGWWWVDLNPDTSHVELEMVESDSPRFLTVDTADEVQEDGNFYRVRGAVDGPLPDNAKAVAPGPDTVETRDALSGARTVAEVLDKWLESNPPPRSLGLHRRVGLELLQEADVPVPRPCRLRSVRVQDFYSHRDTQWDLEDGVHMIVGQSRFYRSNGAGKSALLEAFYWCMTGKTTKGSAAADVIRWGADEARVTCTVHLEDVDKVLTVTRTRKKNAGALEVLLDGEPVEAETNRALDAALTGIHGLPPDLILSLGYFSQEDVVLLSRATDAQVKDRLADLSGSRIYDQGAEGARALVKEHTKVAERTQGKVEALEAELTAALESQEAKQRQHALWEEEHGPRIRTAVEAVDAAKRRDTQRTELWKARVERAGRAAIDRKEVLAEEAEDRVPDLTNKFAKELSVAYKAERVRFETRAANLESKVPKTKTVEELLEAHAAILQNKERAADQRRKLKAAVSECDGILLDLYTQTTGAQERLDELRAGTCPTCGQTVPKPEDAIRVLEDEITRIEERREKVQTRRTDAEDLLTKVDDPEELEEKAKELGTIIDLCAGLKDYRTKIADLVEKEDLVRETAREKAERVAAEDLKDEQEAVDDRIDAIISRVEEETYHNMAAVGSAERELDRVRNETNPHTEGLEIEDARVLRIRRNRWSAFREQRGAERQAEVGRYWEGAMGKSGIQSLLMDQLAAQFNACRGEVFPTLTRGVYDVQFSTTSRTQAGELRERIEFQVYQRGVRVPYANLSGGQRRRLDLGVLLTMTMAASRAYGIRGTMGVMFLDEVASFLDDDGVEALAETLGEYDAVDSVWVVSQETDLQALFSSVLFVEQDEQGVSRIAE